ncbi:MAG: hypothetical protein COB15_15605 [Flavobacteriales bacterium]|nr:MAG: hypothetical protein COB15_15605 [Flavobacteriales bacterium]
MKKLAIILIPLIIVQFSFANNGDTFPSITGESLKNKMIELPKAAKGKYCLIGMASSRKAEADLQTWMQPVYDLFINQNTFIPIDYNMDIFFIPMFTGANQAAYKKVMKKTKAEIDPELAPYVLFYKGSLDPYKAHLKDKNKPYFFVLDENGKIVYSTSGKYTAKKLDQIEGIVFHEKH